MNFSAWNEILSWNKAVEFILGDNFGIFFFLLIKPALYRKWAFYLQNFFLIHNTTFESAETWLFSDIGGIEPFSVHLFRWLVSRHGDFLL